MSPGGLLLLALEDAVRRSPGPSGCEGLLAIGVADGGGEQWWQIELGPRAHSATLAGRPARADLGVLFDGAAALELLRTGSVAPGASIRYQGELALLQAFCRRYLRPRSWLDLRRGANA